MRCNWNCSSEEVVKNHTFEKLLFSFTCMMIFAMALQCLVASCVSAYASPDSEEKVEELSFVRRLWNKSLREQEKRKQIYTQVIFNSYTLEIDEHAARLPAGYGTAGDGAGGMGREPFLAGGENANNHSFG
eukprot:g2455.t1